MGIINMTTYLTKNYDKPHRCPMCHHTGNVEGKYNSMYLFKKFECCDVVAHSNPFSRDAWWAMRVRVENFIDAMKYKFGGILQWIRKDT